jgi:putative PIN family toxin of toxin-antitoxin system
VKLILDTNVFISGIFFSGPPYKILKAWRDGHFTLVVSQEILEEYHRVGLELAKKFPGIDIEPLLALIAVEGEIIAAPPLPNQVCDDPDDDKFLACALAARCTIIVSGDRHLRKADGFHGIQVLSPRKLLDEYL